jgi:hypothetical protein
MPPSYNAENRPKFEPLRWGNGTALSAALDASQIAQHVIWPFLVERVLAQMVEQACRH